ncbi:MAG TPA: thermostable hemolysin [Rhodocyclaceae bacterium]|nr:thermostable hemolysin [Rhodocyclaceae bacterium]
MKPLDGRCGEVLARIGHASPLTLRMVSEDAPAQDRSRLESFVRDCFAARYGARIRHFLPALLGLEDAAGRLRATVGLRCAVCGPLFLERYLDRAIEHEIAAACGALPQRAQIVEVGNLAALGNGNARLLIVALTDLLVTEGFEWVVFTGTTEVLNSFRRLSLSPLTLGTADPARMGDELGDWGSYYDSHPHVMAGYVRGGHERLASAGRFQRLGHRSFHAICGAHDVAVA